MPKYNVAFGLDVEVERSEKDGTLVIHILGEDNVNGENACGPVLRIYLNDDPIYENPVYED